MEECAEVDVCEDEPLGRVCLEAVKVNAEGTRLGGGEDLVVVVVVVVEDDDLERCFGGGGCCMLKTGA